MYAGGKKQAAVAPSKSRDLPLILTPCDLRGVKLRLLKRVDELAKQRPALFLKQIDGTLSDKDGYSVAAVSIGLLGNYRFESSATSSDGLQLVDPSKTLTGESRLSLVDLLQRNHFEGDANKHPDLGFTYKEVVCEGKANLFISFAYKSNFSELVNAVERYFLENNLDEDTTYLSFDPIVNNQWLNSNSKAAGKRDISTWTASLRNAISEIGHTVVVVTTPWEDPFYMKRLWCLLEIDYTVGTRDGKYVKFGIAMTLAQKTSFFTGIMRDFDNIYKSYQSIDIKKAICWDPKDFEDIRTSIETSSGGYDAVNRRLLEGLRLWMLLVTEQFLVQCRREVAAKGEKYEKKNEKKNFTEEDVNLCFILGPVAKLCQAQGDLNRAIELQEECVEVCKRVLGSDNRVTLNSMHNLSTSYAKRGDFTKGIVLGEECFEIRKRVMGATHPDTMETLKGLFNMNNARDAISNDADSGPQSATKERLRKKLEAKKASAAAAGGGDGGGDVSTTAPSSSSVTPPAPPALSEEELLDLFKGDNKGKKKQGGGKGGGGKKK